MHFWTVALERFDDGVVARRERFPTKGVHTRVHNHKRVSRNHEVDSITRRGDQWHRQATIKILCFGVINLEIEITFVYLFLKHFISKHTWIILSYGLSIPTISAGPPFRILLMYTPFS